MHKLLLLFGISICSITNYAQFKFYGEVNNEYTESVAYLLLVEDYNKIDLFLTENILQECKIDSSGSFMFQGDFLTAENRIYKIHIDNCGGNVTDYKHLLYKCGDCEEVVFIANNKDKIFFPLNDLSQMLCSFKGTSIENSAINGIDSLQESLLLNLEYAKSDNQRNNIYKNHFKEIQKYSKTFNEPLAELYAYSLYANEESFSREFYLNDFKKSDYYIDLLERLEIKYASTKYLTQYKGTLLKDQYPQFEKKANLERTLLYLLTLLLLVSVIINFFLFKKRKKKKEIDYKTVLTKQEQNILELINDKLTNKQIADKLFISLSTVKTHINNIYSKLSISSRKDIDQFFDYE
jgi:DNA-binding CsgD family transcriptional regulator